MDVLNALWGLLWPLMAGGVVWVALMVWGVVYSTKENKSLDKWMEDFDE